MLAGSKGKNIIEVLFSTFIMFTFVGMFAYIMNCIGMILDEKYKR